MASNLRADIGNIHGFLVQFRVRPDILGSEVQEEGLELEIDADGWRMSDSVDTWDCCMLVNFNILLDVPSQHQEVWVEAFTRMLQRIKEADK